MKRILLVCLIGMALLLQGCAVYPAYGYRPYGGYVQPYGAYSYRPYGAYGFYGYRGPAYGGYRYYGRGWGGPGWRGGWHGYRH